MDHWAISLMLLLLAVVAFTAMSASELMSMEDDNVGHLFDLDAHSDEMACYYCINVTSNEICNRYAIERPCPTDLTVCHTHHVMDDRGKTLAVTKTCATPRTCFSQVGCRRDKTTNQTVCVNCCDLSYCNEEVAFNVSAAVFHRSNDDGTAAFSSATHGLIGCNWTTTAIVILGLLTFLSASTTI
ncbi:ly6/PLAUR domain-containing protein 6B-like [Daphnia pulicaria]|uniref:ly6/PLAUR domain-containing protein 6B-like n=1 Tax=Daphnia pulicaria TaxID=35523 RepID=UPI001EEA169A|nr:ly6/PLAUR domain-containing protein 6B-like [Daphnia pulicaria]